MKYGTVVKVKSGFYEGFYGYIVEELSKEEYMVELKLIKNNSSTSSRDLHFYLENLEIQPFTSLD